MKILECIHLLCYSDAVEYEEEHMIAWCELQQATVACISAVWKNLMEPKCRMHSTRSCDDINDGSSSGSSSSSSNHRMMDGMHAPYYDHHDHSISLPQLIKVLMAFIIDLAQCTVVHAELMSTLLWLVEHICATEMPGTTIAVHKGIFWTCWHNSGSCCRCCHMILSTLGQCILPYARCDTFIQVCDPYTVGWIHMEMMSCGVIQALCDFTHNAFLSSNNNHDMAMAVAEIWQVLCDALHTRLILMQGQCFGFLLQHLKEFAQEKRLFVLNVSVDLVAVAVKTVSWAEKRYGSSSRLSYIPSCHGSFGLSSVMLVYPISFHNHLSPLISQVPILTINVQQRYHAKRCHCITDFHCSRYGCGYDNHPGPAVPTACRHNSETTQ